MEKDLKKKKNREEKKKKSWMKIEERKIWERRI